MWTLHEEQRGVMHVITRDSKESKGVAWGIHSWMDGFMDSFLWSFEHSCGEGSLDSWLETRLFVLRLW